MINKKALSDVVATVLLILLVIVAIFIIWLFVRPAVSQTDSVKDAGSCISTRLSPVECSYTRADAQSSEGGGRHALIIINRGGGEGAITGFTAILKDASGETKLFNSDSSDFLFNSGNIIGNGEAKSYVLRIDKFVPVEISIAAVIGKNTCAPLENPIQCAPYNGPTPCADVSLDGTDWGQDNFVNGNDFDFFTSKYEAYKKGTYYDSHLDFNGDSVINDQDFEVFADALNLGGNDGSGGGNQNCPEV